MRIFRVGNKAIVIEEISHWWVAAAAPGGRPKLCFSMRNGKQINFGPDDTSNGDDGHAIEQAFIEFAQKEGRA
ncbi:hypothetical protein [Novosphingobium guangzhouense]|uniref:Uncharacterized protein n=1 Tax=Novosphingobium guangzhouense TaxID=1850347 RepID=A0A2K2G620_9SPHN|nr:hypothetical protein [Novosphingobium guangzhouense]PNU06479.1 hypothetical protein A8V01_02745 [Novosphingobium guangzhouense]